MEVSQIGSENVHGFSCGNFSAAKERVLGSPCSLACLLSSPATPSLRGKHHQIKTHSTRNYKILQISWIWSWQAVKPFNIVSERKKAKGNVSDDKAISCTLVISPTLISLAMARASPDDDGTWFGLTSPPADLLLMITAHLMAPTSDLTARLPDSLLEHIG